MAIDFMVMPMSRYISGDFVSPTMRLAWEQGLPYKLIGPDGVRELPLGLPFGGEDAPVRRQRIIETVLDDLRAASHKIAAQLWDERSEVEPCFHRVDVASYHALVEYYAAHPGGSFLGIRTGPKMSHCTASLFLPCDFREPVDMTSPFERTAAATSRALAELSHAKYPAEARSAAETLSAALEDSRKLRLPLIVDW
ncbi:MAG TPA: hypothetical protein VI197_08665 [Polyangiaceae bacterium]